MLQFYGIPQSFMDFLWEPCQVLQMRIKRVLSADSSKEEIRVIITKILFHNKELLPG